MPGRFTRPEQIKSLGAPARPAGRGKINAFCMEQSKKLWGELNHRTYWSPLPGGGGKPPPYTGRTHVLSSPSD